MVGRFVTYKDNNEQLKRGLYLGLGSLYEELSNGIGQYTTILLVDCDTGGIVEVSEFNKVNFDDPHLLAKKYND